MAADSKPNIRVHIENKNEHVHAPLTVDMTNANVRRMPTSQFPVEEKQGAT